MIESATGNILESEADCIVNTVNCEGYMGKGLAYQFKLKYPENNKEYIKACQNGSLRIGTLHCHSENGKMIVNFPTKDNWREDSKPEYIEKGLAALARLIPELNISSIAVPPLGCGNGGLNWADVKPLIEKYLSETDVHVYVYEPAQNKPQAGFQESQNESKDHILQPAAAPKLSAAALIVMKIKEKLNPSGNFRLQAAAFFVNVFSQQNEFTFVLNEHELVLNEQGPYSNSINKIEQDIETFLKAYDVSLHEAYKMTYRTLVSKSVESKLNTLSSAIEEAANYVNAVHDDRLLENITKILYLIREKGTLSEDEIVFEFKSPAAKTKNGSGEEIRDGINYLSQTKIIQKNLIGYSLPTGSQKRKA
ncbi:hypothetical protein MsAg5_06960 [Methanosarcinaceae archaeon Ag5]|uniref:Macro domain-containing protein n=1 Tax=Methanolapillus africanus TaxID=3028297 RepID=A0AAE4MKJ8_9EURY|nr:hypothetical protein [Methanosarcinaceae archaeon Ag5]